VLLSKLEATRPFTEAEAWTLYKIVALSEAAGWTLLIAGILIRHFELPGHSIAVPIAGQIHGTIFLIYFGVSVTIYGSLRWSRKKFLAAILAGIPPYGTLVFEQWAARTRRTKHRRVLFRSFMLSTLTNNL
jgi:integral membrane protein